MNTETRIRMCRLLEEIEKNREYADCIGVFNTSRFLNKTSPSMNTYKTEIKSLCQKKGVE